MTEIVITFGTDHNEEHRAVVPHGTLSEGYVIIEAPTYHLARNIAYAIFGPKFAFDYPAESWLAEERHLRYHREGLLLRVAWLGPDRLSEASEAIERAGESTEADDMEPVFEARDMLVDALADIAWGGHR